METEIYEMIHKVHEALEGRYDLDGYDLTTIYYFLCEYSNSSTKNDESVIAHVSGSVCQHEFVSREYSSQPYGTCISCGQTVFGQTDH